VQLFVCPEGCLCVFGGFFRRERLKIKLGVETNGRLGVYFHFFVPGSHITDVHTNVLTTAREDCILSQPWRAMRFEWDEQKNRQNLHKHDVRFETAVLVFDDPYAITQRDVTFENEERWITVGAIGPGSILLVVHTFL